MKTTWKPGNVHFLFHCVKCAIRGNTIDLWSLFAVRFVFHSLKWIWKHQERMGISLMITYTFKLFYLTMAFFVLIHFRILLYAKLENVSILFFRLPSFCQFWHERKKKNARRKCKPWKKLRIRTADERNSLEKTISIRIFSELLCVRVHVK